LSRRFQGSRRSGLSLGVRGTLEVHVGEELLPVLALPLAVASGLALLLAVRLRAAARPGGLLESLRT